MALRDDLLIWNERVKLFGGFVNALGLGLIGFAVLRPLTDDALPISATTGLWAAIGLALHGVSHYILGRLRKEDVNVDL